MTKITYFKYRSLIKSDWEQVSKIYRVGIDTGNATFESEVPVWEEWSNHHLKSCRIVAEIDDVIVGWGALSSVSNRYVYRGVAEVSLYVSNEYFGLKIGSGLLEKLITESEENGIWTLQAGIFPENIASIKIHERLGFRNVGYREKIGKMNGVWRDTILFERRSKKIGII